MRKGEGRGKHTREEKSVTCARKRENNLFFIKKDHKSKWI